MGEFEQAVSIHELYPVFLMEGDELNYIYLHQVWIENSLPA